MNTAGDFLAWWTNSDEGSKVYHFEVAGHIVEVVADNWTERDGNNVLMAGDVEVATIYVQSFAASWFEGRA